MGLHFSKDLAKGYNPLVESGESGLTYLDLGIVVLEDEESFGEDTVNNEVGLIILTGKCTVEVRDKIFPAIGGRPDVFSGNAYAVYIPCKNSFSITALGSAEVAVVKAPSDLESEARLIKPEDVLSRSVGKLNWRRDVKDIIDLRTEAKHLVIGETINPPGNWSSAPPHRHDYDRLPEEVNMEEVYFYKVKPKGGFGMQRIYKPDGSVEQAFVVQENDAVAIPEGFHPVVAAPGYSLYYLWALAGEQRILRPYDDPQHSWLKNAEPIIGEMEKR